MPSLAHCSRSTVVLCISSTAGGLPAGNGFTKYRCMSCMSRTARSGFAAQHTMLAGSSPGVGIGYGVIADMSRMILSPLRRPCAGPGSRTAVRGRNRCPGPGRNDGQRLLQVEPRVTETPVVVADLAEVILVRDALGDVVGSYLKMKTSGRTAAFLDYTPEIPDLTCDRAQKTGLVSAWRPNRIGVHGVAEPDDRMPGRPGRCHHPGQHLCHAPPA